MDLPFVTALVRPGTRAGLPAHAPGDAFLAGGTWLFSDPQPSLSRLVDLGALGWPPVGRTADGLRIAATCTLSELEAHELPPDWRAGHLVARCCRSLLGSFKIRRSATVGGNLCLALPAGPIAPLAVALDATCVVWTPAGSTREIPAAGFVTGPQRNALAPGEILREIAVPASALRSGAAFRRIALTAHGRSAALLIGTRHEAGFSLTITAATPSPRRLDFGGMPDRGAVAARIGAEIDDWHDDVHGAPDWRAHVTGLLAAEIVEELGR